MAKKHVGVLESLGGAFGILKDTIVSSIKSRIKENFDQAMEILEERLMQIQRRMLHSLGVAVLAFAALVVLLIAGMFYLLDTLSVSRAGAFLGLAFALAIASLILYLIPREHRR